MMKMQILRDNLLVVEKQVSFADFRKETAAFIKFKKQKNFVADYFIDLNAQTEFDENFNIKRILINLDKSQKHMNYAFDNYYDVDCKERLLIILETECSFSDSAFERKMEGNPVSALEAASFFGKLGGSKTSKAKKKSSAENGKLGGRPKKITEKVGEI